MGEILLLIVLFVIGGLLQAAGKRRREEPPTSGPLPELEPSGSGGMMAEIQKALEEMKRANEAATFDDGEADADEVEAVTREVEAEVRNLDEVAPRPERVRVDQDEAIEALTAKRAEWVEARSRSHSPADHRAFDAKIRAVEPGVPSGPDRAAALRRMIIWQEVLGKPVALRRPEDR